MDRLILERLKAKLEEFRKILDSTTHIQALDSKLNDLEYVVMNELRQAVWEEYLTAYEMKEAEGEKR